MTIITLSASPDGSTYMVQSRGHAETPEVCAAVSALIQTLQGWAHAAGLQITEESMEPGACVLCYTGHTAYNKLRGSTAFELIEIGLLRLQETAPEQVKVIFPREG